MIGDGVLCCPHGWPAVMIERDGWTVPTAPPTCRLCDGWEGCSFKLPTEDQQA